MSHSTEPLEVVSRVLALTEEQALEDTQRTTRRFARRQDTWFRRDDRVVWLPYDADDLLDGALAAVAR